MTAQAVDVEQLAKDLHRAFQQRLSKEPNAKTEGVPMQPTKKKTPEELLDFVARNMGVRAKITTDENGCTIETELGSSFEFEIVQKTRLTVAWAFFHHAHAVLKEQHKKCTGWRGIGKGDYRKFLKKQLAEFQAVAETQ